MDEILKPFESRAGDIGSLNAAIACSAEYKPINCPKIPNIKAKRPIDFTKSFCRLLESFFIKQLIAKPNTAAKEIVKILINRIPPSNNKFIIVFNFSYKNIEANLLVK